MTYDEPDNEDKQLAAAAERETKQQFSPLSAESEDDEDDDKKFVEHKVLEGRDSASSAFGKSDTIDVKAEAKPKLEPSISSPGGGSPKKSPPITFVCDEKVDKIGNRCEMYFKLRLDAPKLLMLELAEAAAAASSVQATEGVDVDDHDDMLPINDQFTLPLGPAWFLLLGKLTFDFDYAMELRLLECCVGLWRFRPAL